jgi:hypothetical protein
MLADDRGQMTEDRRQKTKNWEVGMRNAEGKKLRSAEDQKRMSILIIAPAFSLSPLTFCLYPQSTSKHN